MAAAMEDAVRKLRDGERAMKARAEASERLSSEIVASLTSGLLVVDGDGIVRTLNPAGQTMLGLAGQPLGRALSRSAEGRRAARRRARGVPDDVAAGRAPGGAADRRRRVASRPDGLADSRRTAAAPRTGVICLFSDLTEVMELEEQLRLKDSLARLGEMTAGIAHEFRNGLATIHGYGRLLDLERLPADYRPYVQGIRDETEALGQVVTNFLNFARPTELALAPVEMAALVERAAEEIRADVRARGGDVIVRGEFGRVEGDEVLLRQALSNLCRNAFEACDQARIVPQIVIEGQRDPVARRRSASASATTARRSRQRRRPRLPAVLHDQGAGHRPRPRPRPEDHRHAQRPRHASSTETAAARASSSPCRFRRRRRGSEHRQRSARLQLPIAELAEPPSRINARAPVPLQFLRPGRCASRAVSATRAICPRDDRRVSLAKQPDRHDRSRQDRALHCSWSAMSRISDNLDARLASPSSRS